MELPAADLELLLLHSVALSLSAMPGVRPSDCGLSVLLSEPGSTPAVEMLSHNVSRPHNADMIGDDQLT